MTARHILMTADAVGGVWQYALELAGGLCAQGDRVTLAVLGPAPTSDQRRQAARIDGLALLETGLALDWLAAGPEPVRRSAEALAALAGRLDADLVHCNAPTLAACTVFPVPLVAVAHGCVTTWWQAAKDEPLIAEYRWHRSMTRDGLLAAHVAVAPSAAHAALLQRTYALPARPLVVHNGRREPAAAASARGPLDAALTVGRLWDGVKGAALLDRVAARVSIPFLAAGQVRGPHGETFRAEHLQCLGEVEGQSLDVLLAQRPIFVSAASFEPFGLAVLEAAAAGCALVLADIPTFRELWDGAALFVAVGDTDGFATAIECLRSDPALRARLGQAAAAQAATYTPEATTAAMLQVYDGLLGRAEVAA